MSVLSKVSIRSRYERPAHGLPVVAGNIWDVLEGFARELDQAVSYSAQVHCLLEAVRTCLQVDTVFTHTNQPGERFEFVAGRPLPVSWCRRVVAQNLETLAASSTSYGCFSGSHAGVGSEWMAHNTLMVKFKKAKAFWVVALRSDPQHSFQRDDLKIVLLIRRLFRDHDRQAHAQRILADAMLGVVHGLNEAISAKSPFTSGHSERVARMAVCLGRQMKLPAAVLSDLYLAGLMHDVGKIGIRDDVLQKQGPLSDEETAHIRTHPLIGNSIVAKIKILAHLCQGVRHHHERCDGQGYPDRLSGQAIPLLARILSVVDACDAMMSPRPYRPGLPTEQVDARMRAGAGTQWDPELIEHFMACRHELYGIYEKGIGESVVHAVQETIRARLAD